MKTIKKTIAQYFGSHKKSPLCHNKQGGETPDPTPLSVTVGLKKPPTIQEMIKKYMAAASLDASMKGLDSFEEADDFDCDDDFDPTSPYEHDFDQIMDKGRYGQQPFKEEVPAKGDAQKSPGPTSPEQPKPAV